MTITVDSFSSDSLLFKELDNAVTGPQPAVHLHGPDSAHHPVRLVRSDYICFPPAEVPSTPLMVVFRLLEFLLFFCPRLQERWPRESPTILTQSHLFQTRGYLPSLTISVRLQLLRELPPILMARMEFLLTLPWSTLQHTLQSLFILRNSLNRYLMSKRLLTESLKKAKP